MKPENILIGLDDRIKLSDFGLSKILTKKENYLTNSICGTPEYCSPEMIN